MKSLIVGFTKTEKNAVSKWLASANNPNLVFLKTRGKGLKPLLTALANYLNIHADVDRVYGFGLAGTIHPAKRMNVGDFVVVVSADRFLKNVTHRIHAKVRGVSPTKRALKHLRAAAARLGSKRGAFTRTPSVHRGRSATLAWFPRDRQWVNLCSFYQRQRSAGYVVGEMEDYHIFDFLRRYNSQNRTNVSYYPIRVVSNLLRPAPGKTIKSEYDQVKKRLSKWAVKILAAFTNRGRFP